MNLYVVSIKLEVRAEDAVTAAKIAEECVNVSAHLQPNGEDASGVTDVLITGCERAALW